MCKDNGHINCIFTFNICLDPFNEHFVAAVVVVIVNVAVAAAAIVFAVVSVAVASLNSDI